MNTSTTCIAAGLVFMAMGTSGYADTMGAISTDRFGYTGTVVKYGSLADAQAGVNPTGTTTIGNRDI